MNPNEQQFIRLAETHRALIYKVCYLYASSPAEIDDYFQEVLVRLWEAWPRFRGESKPSTWVYRIALYTCISFVRRRIRRPHSVPLSITLPAPEEDERSARIEALHEALNRLGSMERALILLWLEERTYEEIAEITGLSRANVAVKLFRTKEKLRKLVTE